MSVLALLGKLLDLLVTAARPARGGRGRPQPVPVPARSRMRRRR